MGPYPTERKTAGMSSGRSSAISPRLKYRPLSKFNRAPTSAAKSNMVTGSLLLTGEKSNMVTGSLLLTGEGQGLGWGYAKGAN